MLAKIDKKILLGLLKIGVSKYKIADILGISRMSIYRYMNQANFQKEEINKVKIDWEKFKECVIYDDNNNLQLHFRLPENKINKQKISQVNKVEQKSSFIKSVKKDDEIVKDKTGFDELEEYQNRLKENIVDE